MNWLQKMFTATNWYYIGRFNIDFNDYDDSIPSWVKHRIPNAFDNFCKKNKKKFRKHTVDMVFGKGEWFIEGKHFRYKIVFIERTDNVAGEVYRKYIG
jgi:hypothetical protein